MASESFPILMDEKYKKKKNISCQRIGGVPEEKKCTNYIKVIKETVTLAEVVRRDF